MLDSKKDFILVYGDAFVDYIADDSQNKNFTKFLGGATVNVAAGIARLGGNSSFITITGEDNTSEFVRDELINEGVDLFYSQYLAEKRVSGVYVHLTPENDRIFHTYIDETPNLQVDYQLIDGTAFKRAAAFHFCSGTLFHPTARMTTRNIVEEIKQNGGLLSFDVNVRPLRWESEELCRETILSFMQKVDILKMTDEELFFLTETSSREAGLAALQPYNIPIILLTVGSEGTYAILHGEMFHIPVEKVTAVDTTGAGDAFMAGILTRIQQEGAPQSKSQWVEYISFGNSMGARCATKLGALSAMPKLAEITLAKV